MGGTPAQQAIAKEQAQWWTQHANLAFEFDNAPNAQIRLPSIAAMGRGHLSAPMPVRFQLMSRQ
jgi:hypothetical protein